MKSGPPLRVYLARLAFAMFIPVAALLAYDLYLDAQAVARNSSEAVSHMARFTAQNASRFLAESRTALAVLAQHPLIQELEPARCKAAVSALSGVNPVYANMVVRDRTGKVVCAARGSPGRYMQLLPTAEAVAGVVRQNRFLVSEPLLGATTGRWVVVLRHPVRDDMGRPIGLIHVPIDLVKFALVNLERASSAQSETHIVDAAGTLIASSDDPQRWIGRNARGERIVDFALSRAGANLRAAGLDGIERFYGTAEIPETGWRVISGISVSKAYADFVRSAEITAISLCLLFFFFLGVWFWVRRTITGPIERIAGVAKQIAAGDHEVRTRPGGGPLEIATVASQFNAMLDAQSTAQARLRESEEHFRRLANMSSDWFWEQDENLKYTAVYGDPHSLSGNPEEMFIGKTRWANPYGGISEEEVGRHDALLQGRRPFRDLEYWRIGADGKLRYRSITGQPVFDADGGFKGYRGTGRDITERKLTENALRESERRYRNLFDNMLEGFAYCRMIFENGRPLDFVYVEVNPAFERLTGLKNIVGKKVTEIIPGIREINPDVFERFGRVASTGNPERFETFIAPLKIWITVSAFCPEEGCFVAVFENVTGRKQREQALRESEDRLRQAYQARERLAQDLHDGIVQSIYAVGLGLEQVQRQTSEDPKEAKKNLSEAIIRLNAVIREVRNHIVGLKREELDWMQLLGELHAVIRAASATHGVQFSLDADPIILARLSAGMAHEVLNIVREAVSNSLRHSGGKRGMVSLGERDGRVLLMIEDDGAGFDVSKPRGAGQGLRNMAARAQTLAAQFHIRSSPGSGTRVIVEIPLEPEYVSG